MSGSYRVGLGAFGILLLLVFASFGAEASVVYVGELGLYTEYWQNPQFMKVESQEFNGSDYEGPYENYWPPGSTLNFSLVLDVKNVCGLTMDFMWEVSCDVEGEDDYTIFIEDDQPVHNDVATHYVYDVDNFENVTIYGYIEIDPQFPWDCISILVMCWGDGHYDAAQWDWAGDV